MLIKSALVLGLTAIFYCHTASAEWRSTLYPKDWQPGYEDKEGHFLHDFSYAGYHRGEKPLPVRKDNIVDVTKAPYLADPTGKNDATAAIQSALDAVGEQGGGVVFMPSGTYRIAPKKEDTAALKMQYDNVVLRGAGVDKTFLYNDEIFMRGKCMISLRSKNAGFDGGTSATQVTAPGAPESMITEDLPKPVTQIPVQDTSLFSVGELVVVRNTLTQHYIDLLHMTGKWTPGDSPNRTITYYRNIVAIDPAKKLLTVDIPLRGFLYKADNARVVKFTGKMINEAGLEDFSMGMREHPGVLEDPDVVPGALDKPGTPAYEIAWSTALDISYAENCWVLRVNSYQPPGNHPTEQQPASHVLSCGIQISRSRLVTIEDCEWKFPQYYGGGGNGYLFVIKGNDCLFKNCRTEGGRHNFTFSSAGANGNVILNFHSKDGKLGCDFHNFLSLANLIDSATCEGSFLEARYRPWGGKIVHGETTTESVFWNTTGLRYPEPKKAYVVQSHQFGMGYVIGTQGPASAVESNNFVEGVGKSATLEPQSLYEDQFKRRMERSQQ